jgi:tetratricopeptide (TPR) repeat protein
MCGRLQEASSLLEAVLAESSAADPFARGALAFNLVEVHAANEDPTAGIRLLDEVVIVIRAAGGLAYASTLLAWKAALLLEQVGNESLAAHTVEEAASVTSPYDSMSVAMVEACRGVLAAREEQHDAAARHLDLALVAIDATDQDLQRGDIRRWTSEIPARRGDTAGQRRLLEEALALYRSKGHVPHAQQIARKLAEVQE